MNHFRPASKHFFRFLLLALLGAIWLHGASPDKRITIYSPTTTYTLNLVEHSGRDYVGLLEILEPLGRVSAKTERQRWKLRFNNIDAQFTNHNNQARIGRRDLDLTAPFLLQNDRGLVPVDALATLLPGFLGTPVTFHSIARRLFIQQNGTSYSAELSSTNPSRVAFNFSAPVNPRVATEPGKVTLLFPRDPVVASGPATLNFKDKTITAATFQESNGAAEITVAGTVPLMASFSNNGRTITIAPAPSATAAPPAASTPAPGVQAATSPPAPPAPTPVSPAPVRRYLVALDASHGGDERGAALADNLPEKDVTLALARRIRGQLENRGISTLMLRDGDATLSADQRASSANSAHVSVYLAIHAGTDGIGVRICTAALASQTDTRGPFLSWNTAQAAYISASQAVANNLEAQLSRSLPARLLSAPLRPLNNVIAPAVAIEIAPRQPGNVADLNAPDYQQSIAAALATAIANARDGAGGAH